MPSRFSAKNIGNFVIGVACVLWIASLFAAHLLSILSNLPPFGRILVGLGVAVLLLVILVSILRRRWASQERRLS